MGSENRRRQRMVPIRLSDEEFERIKQKAEVAGVTVPSFLRELALKQKVQFPLIDRESAKELLKQLRGMGNNLNQLTKLAHQGISVVYLEEAEREFERVWQLLNSLAQK